MRQVQGRAQVYTFCNYCSYYFSVVSYVSRCTGAKGVAGGFPQHPSCFLHLLVLPHEAIVCGAIWSWAIKATFRLISFATCIVIPALSLELLIIIHCNMADSILFCNNSGQFLHVCSDGSSFSGCSYSHWGNTGVLGVCAFLCFPPCQDTNARCSVALLPWSVQAHAYDRVLCISVTIASRARPYTFTLTKIIILSRHLMLWTNNQIIVPAYLRSFSSDEFTGTVAACAGQAEQKTLSHRVCPKPRAEGWDPCLQGSCIPQLPQCLLIPVLALQYNFPVHFYSKRNHLPNPQKPLSEGRYQLILVKIDFSEHRVLLFFYT